MGFIIPIFFSLCVLSVGIQVIALLKKRFPNTKVATTVLSTPKDKAKYYVGLAASGVVSNHTISNKSTPRSDNVQYESYCSFLSPKSIETIKNLRGDNPFVKD